MSKSSTWTSADIGDLTGKTALVTGANSGIGYEMVRELARKGARVVLASRSESKGQAAIAALRQELGRAALEFLPLDLADLASVRSFAAEAARRYPVVDILCNNAGVMALPYQETKDGFEMQFGTNHLGHFALTGLLLKPILAAQAGRIVTISSGLHKRGKINFEDLQGRRSYDKWRAYSQSKLANLLFAYELQRRLEASGAPAISVAAHPGYAATNLQFAGPNQAGSRIAAGVAALMNKLLAQSAAMGTLPGLYAATAPEVRGGDYIGPSGLGGIRGYPVKVPSSARSHDREAARRLWEISEQLTGVRYELLEGKTVGAS